MTRKSWPLAVVAGACTTALVGGVALAGFQPFAGPDGMVVGGPPAAFAAKDQPRDKLKEILDALVAKNTITQAQEEAILQALRDGRPSPKPKAPGSKPVRPNVPKVRSFIGDVVKTTSQYLGVDRRTLVTELRAGKSLAELANAAPGKSAQGLIDTLTAAADGKVDRAVAANRLTTEQAATLKPKIAAEITTVVDRSFTKRPPHPLAPVRPTPTPKS
ncbi:MAG TPA: hypothetical protein VGT60_05720 [Candidatus Limnocylindria bacterium]|nr:hypothetical protein [Candidatus Limnocylindria bacterium]